MISTSAGQPAARRREQTRQQRPEKAADQNSLALASASSSARNPVDQAGIVRLVSGAEPLKPGKSGSKTW